MNDALDKATAFFDSLYGAPGVLLVLVTCNALGYFLKLSSWCDNKNIPRWVVLWGIVSNVVFRGLPVVPLDASGAVAVWAFIQHFGRLIAVGFLIGVVSSILYDKVLSQLENKWPWLKEFLTPVNGGDSSTTRTAELTIKTSETTDGGKGQPSPAPKTGP